MSLKSFDKFCENMIKGEPVDNKEIFDERQKMVRSRLAMEAMTVYVCLSLLASMSYEFIYQWAESITIAFMTLGAAVSMMIIGGWNTFMYGSGGFDFDGSFCAAKDGMLTNDFLAVMTFAIIAVLGIIIFVKISRLKKSDARENGEENPKK